MYISNHLVKWGIWGVLFLFTQSIAAQEIYPEKEWEKIDNPTELGWSQAKLAEAHRIADSIGSDAVMIIYKGAILDAWGDIHRKFMCHSMRKSFMSAMMGIYVDQGMISLDRTLAELHIDDTPYKLRSKEKTASIRDLLSSRSGIYLPAAYEFPARKPKRGQYNPGENWYYANNWDYNSLLTIFEQETHEKFFEAFYQKLALPLQMNDFEVSDGYYHYEKHKSSHPAYPFRMSARDLARLGLLFLRNGKWKEQQVISTEWVQLSTSFISQTYGEGEGYGYLWWVDQKNFRYPYFSAEGHGRHCILVVPAIDLVIVHRVNTYAGKNLSYRQRGALIRKILEAKNERATEPLPKLSPFEYPQFPLPFPRKTEISTLAPYTGTYRVQKLQDFESDSLTIGMNASQNLYTFIPYKGYFELIPITQTLFMLEDSYEYINFIFDSETGEKSIIYHQNSRLGHAFSQKN